MEKRKRNKKTLKYTEEELDATLDKLLIERGEHPERVRNSLYGEERKLAKDLVIAITKEKYKWLFNQWEDSSDRYMEAEKFILDIKWYELLFTNKRLRFLKSRDKI
jgi:hypothetical protein